MTVIKNIGLIQTPVGRFALAGSSQAENLKIRNAAIVVEDGKIQKIFSDGQMPEIPAGTEVIDAGGRLVTPGLVDAHTHMVFGGWRQHEIPLKLSGASYLDILRAGGGILSTVKMTREAGFDELLDKSLKFADEMLSFGVTTVEAKSGYGLNLDDEIKQLEVIKALNSRHVMDFVPTFMGAHAIPPEYSGNGDGYINYVCDTVLPEVAEKKLAKYCDVFCENSVFNVAQSEKLLTRANELGLGLKIHADEIDEIGGAVLAGKLKSTSAEHLIATGDSGIESLANGAVVAVLLPQTSLYLNKSFARARDMISFGVPVAIASDFNPGSCPSLNIQLSMNLGYLRYMMKPEEILTAVTLNAAAAIGLSDSIGSIEEGKAADLVIWDAADLEMIIYRMGTNLVHSVIKSGKIVTEV